MKLKIIIYCFLFCSAYALGTEKPKEENLKKRADLIVKAVITSIKQMAYTGAGVGRLEEAAKTDLKVTLKVLKTLKGEVKGDEIAFSYPDKKLKVHLFRECIGKRSCKAYSNKSKIFLLINQSEEKNYFKNGEKGFVLVDNWFGILD